MPDIERVTSEPGSSPCGAELSLEVPDSLPAIKKPPRATSVVEKARGVRIGSIKEGSAKLEALRRAFAAIDEEQAGFVAASELSWVWTTAFPEAAQPEVLELLEQVFYDIDQDDAGVLDFEEFVDYLIGDDGDINTTGRYRFEKPTDVRQWFRALFDISEGELYSAKSVRSASYAIALVMNAAIILSVVNMMVESMPAQQNRNGGSGDSVTEGIEVACIALFTADFLVRLVCAASMQKFWMDFYNWVDIVSVVPFYLLITGVGSEDGGEQGLLALRVMRLMKIARVLRVLKLGRRAHGVQLLFLAMKKTSSGLLWMFVVLLLCTILFASVMYFAEHDQAEFDHDGVICSSGCRGKWARVKDSTYQDAGMPLSTAFQSIPDCMWWAVVTVTTVGYGDAFPVTYFGKMVATLTMSTSLFVIACPITLLTSSFTATWDSFNRDRFKETRKYKLQDIVGSIKDKDLASPEHIARCVTELPSPPENPLLTSAVTRRSSFFPGKWEDEGFLQQAGFHEVEEGGWF
eukprot:Hpha_TRINITY_DN13541_c0_g1::TRINITY_DN13541_c0_g1_i1::g.111283::m.111283/K04933/KCNS3; potassium voltage-gated channel delayed-rectifier subfamily S member 3